MIANIRSCNLTKLKLSNNCSDKESPLKVDFPSFFDLLRRNPQLIELSLRNNCSYLFSHQPIKIFSFDFDLFNLRILKLNRLNMKEMSWTIGCASQLEELYLIYCCGFKDCQYKSSFGFSKLKFLKMQGCSDCDENVISNLTNGNNLTRIHIDCCDFLSKKVLSKINLENLRELHYLDILSNPPVSYFPVFGDLLRKMPNLQKFYMEINEICCVDSSEAQEENFGDLTSVFQNLRDFLICDSRLSNHGVLNLLDRLPNLEIIILKNMDKVSDDIVSQLFLIVQGLRK